jgi:type 1 glutamine amidotransferase
MKSLPERACAWIGAGKRGSPWRPRAGRRKVARLGLVAALAAGAWGLALLGLPLIRAAAPPLKKIVLIAGKKSHGPNTHEYEKGVRLFQYCLDNSPNVRGVQTVVVTDGWPKDEKDLEGAASILLFSDGSDIEAKRHPLLNGNRMNVFARHMRRGCGYVAVHYTTFTPKDLEGRFLDWVGGYYDYETGPGPKKWWSKHVVDHYKLKPVTPDHPVARGLTPFEMREELYFRMRFRQPDARRRNILSFGGGEDGVVAWAVQREDGGRGFAYTGGHFHKNWENDNVRRMVLNALLWTAKVEVPEGGVKSALPPDWKAQFTPPKKGKK